MNGVRQLSVKKQIEEWFEHFHTYPEVSYKEYETTKKISQLLQGMEVAHHTFDDVTGVIAEIGEGDRILAVRADMDALWQEVDGVFRANHSCGHDANMSMVLGALSYLLDKPLGSRIRFIFQPAEEKGNGALAMIERGAVDGVSHLFGIHLRPQEEIPFGKVSPAIHHGAAIFLEGRVIGVDAHGARPHQGKNALDPIFAISQFVKSLHFSPYEAYSAKLTKVMAGSDNVNIIPGTATFAMDIRAQSNIVLESLREQIEKGIQTIRELHGVEITFEWTDYTPAAEVSEEAANIAEKAIIATVGKEALSSAIITSGSDDFHFYTIKRPHLKATMLGIGADLSPGLHHPHMAFNREALYIGAKVLAETLQKASFLD